jgi:hypothetical protein
MTYDEIGQHVAALKNSGWSYEDIWALARHESAGLTPDDLQHVKAWIGPPPDEPEWARKDTDAAL